MTRRDLMKLSTSALAAVLFAPFLPKSDVLGSRVKVVSAADPAETYPPVGPWKMIAWRFVLWAQKVPVRHE